MTVINPDGFHYAMGKDFSLYLRDGRTTMLGDVVVIVEARKDSGSVDTGRRAHLQGKEVIAINWSKISPLFKDNVDPNVEGLEQLIAEGSAVPFPSSDFTGTLSIQDAPRYLLEFVLRRLDQRRMYPSVLADNSRF